MQEQFNPDTEVIMITDMSVSQTVADFLKNSGLDIWSIKSTVDPGTSCLIMDSVKRELCLKTCITKFQCSVTKNVYYKVTADYNKNVKQAVALALAPFNINYNIEDIYVDKFKKDIAELFPDKLFELSPRPAAMNKTFA